MTLVNWPGGWCATIPSARWAPIPPNRNRVDNGNVCVASSDWYPERAESFHEAPMADEPERPDPSELDLFWSGQSGFAMLPGLVIGVLASAVVMLAAPPIGDWIRLPEELTAFLRFWLVLIGWIILGLIWSYRGAAFVYRLTSSHLYIDFGMLYRPTPPIELTSVTNVECQAWALRRLFRVGSVIVSVAGREPVRLRGIFHPQLFADAIRAAAAKRQKSEVKSTT